MQLDLNQGRPPAPRGAQPAEKPPGRYLGRILLCLALIATFASAAEPGGQGTSDNTSGMPKSTRIPDNQPMVLPDVNQQMIMREQRAKQLNFDAANIARKKLIADESALLLRLAAELKSEVDKTGKDTLSLNVVRKADMVEKLAHDVKEKMKLSVGSN